MFIVESVVQLAQSETQLEQKLRGVFAYYAAYGKPHVADQSQYVFSLSFRTAVSFPD